MTSSPTWARPRSARPGCSRCSRRKEQIIGPDWFPYGIEPNRPTIEALLQYVHEHGLTDRRVKLEELFAPSTLRDIPMSEGQHV